MVFLSALLVVNMALFVRGAFSLRLPVFSMVMTFRISSDASFDDCKSLELKKKSEEKKKEEREWERSKGLQQARCHRGS